MIPSVRIRNPIGQQNTPPKALLSAGVVSLVAYGILQSLAPERSVAYTDAMLDAATLMQRATIATREFCDSVGVEIDEVTDPNRTCLIGPELTTLMTTLGHLDAKRTTTDPAVASLIVHLLTEAGVSAGDTIAVGCSASFPALLVATVAAAEAMNIHPVIMLSLGASTYGATNPEFNLLDIYSLLLREGVFETPPAAVSLGGNEDVGRGFDPELKTELLDQIEATGYRLLSDPDLRTNVSARMEIYGQVTAFVNAGGSYANLGTSSLALQLKPGLNFDVSLPPAEERGVLFEMAAEGIPVIHLLFIRGLALHHGLPWDPIPLSEPGEIELHADQPTDPWSPWLIGVPYLIIVSVLVAVHCGSTSRQTRARAEITL